MAQDNVVAPVITASGMTWADFKTGGIPIGVSKLITANGAKANPTVAATATATGGGSSGGSLAAGDYFFLYTWVDAFGETTVGASVVGAAITVAATNIPRITIPALPTGVSFANIYVSAVNGAATTAYLYASGVTTTTFDLSFAAPTDIPNAGYPTMNTTGAGLDENGSLANAVGSRAPTELLGCSTVELFSAHLSGAPVSRRRWLMVPFWKRGIAKFWDVLMAEIVVLTTANQGTLGYAVAPGVGNPRYSRTMS